MKSILLLLVATALSAFAAAADLALADGRVLKDAAIISQTPRTVIVRHAGGLSSAAKELLPPELRARYPFDETAAREADERAAQEAATARNVEKAEAERQAQLRSQLEARAVEQRTTAKQTEQREEESQMAAHRAKAERLVRDSLHDWIVTFDEFRPVNGRSGPWVISGKATVIYSSEIRTYCDSEIVSPDRGPYYRWPGMEEAQRFQSRGAYSRSFEAVYSVDGPTPTISIVW
jgi:hypothetical protein